MSVRLVSINIESDRHLPQVFAFLESQQPDIVCLAEVFEEDLPLFEEKLGMPATFAAQASVYQENPHFSARGLFGVAQFSRFPVQETQQLYYVGDANNIPEFYKDPDLNDLDTTNNATNRVVIARTYSLPDGKSITIANTHFTWSAAGSSTPRQARDAQEMKRLLATLPAHILVGDLNAPRGGETFQIIANGYSDALPQTVVSTLDPILHRAKTNLVVDAILAHPAYQISNVAVYEGVSDHKALAANIDLKTV